LKYYTLHIDDSGAIDGTEKRVINNRFILVCDMYDDNDYNDLNDMLHSTFDYIMNERALKIFKERKLIPYVINPVLVRRTQRKLGIFKMTKNYSYHQLKIDEPKDLFCYDWINFENSEIIISKNKKEIGRLISHQQLLELIEENKEISSKINSIYKLNISQREKEERSKKYINYSFDTKKIVFNKSFDQTIDLFKIPFYSLGTYVSERLKNSLSENGITDLGFAESKNQLGEVWKPHFPIIEFE